MRAVSSLPLKRGPRKLVLRLFELKRHVLAELLVVLAKLELLACREVFLLDGRDVSHDTALSRDDGHKRTLTFSHMESSVNKNKK